MGKWPRTWRGLNREGVTFFVTFGRVWSRICERWQSLESGQYVYKASLGKGIEGSVPGWHRTCLLEGQ